MRQPTDHWVYVARVYLVLLCVLVACAWQLWDADNKPFCASLAFSVALVFCLWLNARSGFPFSGWWKR